MRPDPAGSGIMRACARKEVVAVGVSVLDGKVAVERAEHGVLGHLLWFTIKDDLSMTGQQLMAAFQAAGVSGIYVPRPVKSCDAFRRATSAAERRRVMGKSGGTYQNLLIAEVRADRDVIERQLVLQEVDADDRELWHSVAARIVLVRKTGTLKVERAAGGAEVDAALAAIEEHYRAALTHFTARHLRDILARMLSGANATVVRPSGGVYFVPVQYEADVQGMRSLLRALGQEFFSVPMVDSADSREMVEAKFREQVSDVVAGFAEVLAGGEAKKGELAGMLARARELFRAVEEYQGLLEADLQDLLNRVDVVKRQALLALEQAAA